MLEANALSKSNGHIKALDTLNLKVEAGEVYCLLGANGAAKTTTINLFLNFITPTSGLAKINGFAASGKAFLMAIHNLFCVKESGTRAGIMKQGRLVATVETESLNPADLEQFYLHHMQHATGHNSPAADPEIHLVRSRFYIANTVNNDQHPCLPGH